MKYKIKNFDTSVELERFLNEEQIDKKNILYIGPSKSYYTLIYIK